MSPSQIAYVALLLAVSAERGIELVISQRNVRWARAAGGVERGSAHYRWMVVVHALFLVSCGAEVLVLDRPFLPWLGLVAGGVVGLSMTLRYWAVSALGRRWNTRVVVIPGLPVVRSGPYRYVRHPNYLAVILEMAALPLVHSAWLTAIVFSVLNAAILHARIAVEEKALSGMTDYGQFMSHRPRFLGRRQTASGGTEAP